MGKKDLHGFFGPEYSKKVQELKEEDEKEQEFFEQEEELRSPIVLEAEAMDLRINYDKMRNLQREARIEIAMVHIWTAIFFILFINTVHELSKPLIIKFTKEDLIQQEMFLIVAWLFQIITVGFLGVYVLQEYILKNRLLRDEIDPCTDEADYHYTAATAEDLRRRIRQAISDEKILRRTCWGVGACRVLLLAEPMIKHILHTYILH